MLIPHSPEPPYLGKRISEDIPPISGIGYRSQLQQKNTTFSWFSREIFPKLRPKNTPPPFPENMGTRMRPPGGPGLLHACLMRFLAQCHSFLN